MTDAVVAPTKVCRSCQAQSQTLATKCPNCGKNYKKKKKWPWILLALVLLFGGCTAIFAAGVDNAVKELNKEQELHAISKAQFDAQDIGTPKSEVIAALGKQPEDTNEFTSQGVLDDTQIKSTCIYYNRQGGGFGDIFQFCFDTDDKMDSKNSF